MASHREPRPPHGALAFFGRRQVTRWRHIERGGWLRDGRRVTLWQTQSSRSGFEVSYYIWAYVNVLMRSQSEARSKRVYKIAKILISSIIYRAELLQSWWIVLCGGECLKIVTCYQSLNKAIMYRSVNILWFCDLLASFTVDFITQTIWLQLAPCTMHDVHVISQT